MNRFDVFTSDMGLLEYIAKKSHKKFDPEKNKDDTDIPIMYYVLGINHKYLRYLSKELSSCDIRDSNTGEPIKIK